ncbi:MAG: HAMP domain-containing protein [Dehalococcoidia bacterium]
MEQRKTRPFLKSLQGKILWQMLVISILPIALVGGLMYNSMSSAENNVNTSLNESRVALENETIGKTKAIQAWNLSVEVEAWIAERIREVKGWAQKGDIVEAARTGQDAGGHAMDYIYNNVNTSVFFGDGYLIDGSAQIIFQLSGDREKSQGSSLVWQEAWSKGLYVSEPQIRAGIGSQYYLIDVAVRVNDLTEEKPLGVLVGSVRLNPGTWATDYGDKVPGNRLLILDSSYQIITDSENPVRYLEADPKWNTVEQQIITRLPDGKSAVEPSYLLAGGYVTGYARATNADTNIIIPQFNGLGWTVIVEQSSEEALAPLDSLENVKGDLNDSTNAMLFTLIAVVVGLIILVPLVSIILSRGITNPVAQLRDVAEKISMGDMSVSIDVKSEDEIGDLADSFERMVMAVRFLSQEEE